MQINKNTNDNYTVRQLKLPLEIEKLCKNDIQYLYLLHGIQAPSFATFENIIRKQLTDSIEQIFQDMYKNRYERTEKSMNVNRAKDATIKVNALPRHPATERFV